MLHQITELFIDDLLYNDVTYWKSLSAQGRLDFAVRVITAFLCHDTVSAAVAGTRRVAGQPLNVPSSRCSDARLQR